MRFEFLGGALGGEDGEGSGAVAFRAKDTASRTAESSRMVDQDGLTFRRFVGKCQWQQGQEAESGAILVLAWVLRQDTSMSTVDGFSVEADLRLAWQGRKVLDAVSYRVLQSLSQSDCIQDAVKLSGVPYRTAWEHIRNAGKAFGQELIHTRSGGAFGGGAVLSEAGTSLLTLFTEARREHLVCIESINQRLDQEWNRPLRHLGGFPC